MMWSNSTAEKHGRTRIIEKLTFGAPRARAVLKVNWVFSIAFASSSDPSDAIASSLQDHDIFRHTLSDLKFKIT